MKITPYILTALAVLAIVLVGCKQDSAPNFHFEYFGLSDGRYVIYDVVEIEHDEALAKHDTVRYQMKTHWADVYTDNEGNEGREYHVYKRNDDTLPWALTDVWTGVYDGIRAELVEENKRIVKLVFAPNLTKEWDANAYNLDDEQRCHYRDIHQDTTINNVKMDSTLVVEIADESNLIDSVRVYEVYQKHIGLVYKHYKNNNYQSSNLPETGKEMYVTYVSSGFE